MDEGQIAAAGTATAGDAVTPPVFVARDLAKAAVLYREYQKRMVDFAHHIVLVQPVYQVAVRKSVGGLNLTAAGWMADLAAAKPA